MPEWNPAFIVLLLLLAPPLGKLARRWQYPVDAALFAAGAMCSYLFVQLMDGDTGLRWDNMKPIIMNYFLPAMVFKSMMNLPLAVMRQCAALIVWLALPLGVASALAIAAGMYHAVGHASGFPWLTALVAGTLLAAVDPGPNLALKSASMVPERPRVLLAGESMLKDVTTILLFSVLLSLPQHGDNQALELSALFMQRFAEAAGLGVITGMTCGYLGSKAMRWLHDDAHNLMLASVASAYGAFMLADHLGGSGIVAVVVTGLMLRLLPRGGDGLDALPAWQFGKESWSFIALSLERLMFMLGGATMTVSMFTHHWRTMLYAIATVLAVRAALLAPTWLALRLAHTDDSAKPSWQHAVYVLIGGGCGVVTLCLALALPLTLESWYTVQSAAYGVVIFCLFVQTPVISWLSRHGCFNTAKAAKGN